MALSPRGALGIRRRRRGFSYRRRGGGGVDDLTVRNGTADRRTIGADGFQCREILSGSSGASKSVDACPSLVWASGGKLRGIGCHGGLSFGDPPSLVVLRRGRGCWCEDVVRWVMRRLFRRLNTCCFSAGLKPPREFFRWPEPETGCTGELLGNARPHAHSLTPPHDEAWPAPCKMGSASIRPRFALRLCCQAPLGSGEFATGWWCVRSFSKGYLCGSGLRSNIGSMNGILKSPQVGKALAPWRWVETGNMGSFRTVRIYPRVMLKSRSQRQTSTEKLVVGSSRRTPCPFESLPRSVGQVELPPDERIRRRPHKCHRTPQALRRKEATTFATGRGIRLDLCTPGFRGGRDA